MDYTSLIKEVNIPELIKALRERKGLLCYGEGACPKNCELLMNHGCYTKLHMDAAAAIEALEAKISELGESYCANLVAAQNAQHEPKRGEWIVKGANRIDCSVCGHSVCFAFGLSEGSLDLYKYCPECGAKMEVQE